MSEYVREASSEWECYAVKNAQLRGDLLSSEYHEFAETVDVAAEAGVRLLAEAYATSNDTFRRHPGKCYEVSEVLHYILREIDVDTSFRGAGANRNGMTHSFLEAKVGDEILWIDGSWQQFLPAFARVDRHPETLIMSAHDAPRVLDRLSISADWRPVWANSYPQSVDSRTNPSVPFRKLLEDRGWAIDSSY